MAPKKITFIVEEEKITGPKGDVLTLVTERGKLPSRYRERKLPRSLSPEAYQMILDVRHHVEEVWQALKAAGLDQMPDGMKKTCLRCHRKEWPFSSCVFNRRDLFEWSGGQEPRDFKGKLLVEILGELLPEEPVHKWTKLARILKEFRAIDTK